MTAPVLSVRGLSKAFAGKTVVDGLRFDLRPGAVVALVGENGAGKSTTKNMLCGLLEPSAGEIRVDGAAVADVADPRHGISAVHQELSLFGALTVAENICMADPPGTAARVDWAAMRRVARAQLDYLGIDIDVDAPVASLGAGRQQIVEIAKALLTANRVLILDEPTTSLTAPEREKLFAIIDRLRDRGLAIVFISHFMEEIYRVCSDFICLRDGAQVGAGRLADMPRRDLEAMMVGRSVGEAGVTLAAPDGPAMLEVEGLDGSDFADVSLSVRGGEIVGVSGLMGAGRTELAEAIVGLRPATGTVRVRGEPVARRSVGAMAARGVAYVPEDRRSNGLFLNRPVRENLSAARLSRFVRRAVRGLGFRGERAAAADLVAARNIAVPHVENPVGDLSGGNQQKTLLARWLAAEPEILIFDEPTKGVDIGAKFEIHETIAALARAGRAVVVVSSDLPELLALSHRIVVMRKGRVAGAVERDDFDPVAIISMAASDGGGGRAGAGA